MKKIYGIMGHPVEHSLSPAMQNAAFKEEGIAAEYKLFDVEPKDVEGFLDAMISEGISGLNVTIPHKISAKDYIERKGILDNAANKLGAVNTIAAVEGGLKGYNTDGPGFYRSLVEDLKFEPEGKNIFILGAGGAARAVVMYLGSGPGHISVFDVDMKRAANLKSHYDEYYPDKKLSLVEADKIEEVLKKTDLLVNATPIGMQKTDEMPVEKAFFHTGLYVYDLVYNRPETQLVREATRMKLRAVTGFGMLLYQGAIAFEIWTGKKAPIGVMRRALKEALGIKRQG